MRYMVIALPLDLTSSNPKRMSWLQPGQKVYVEEREARHAEKLHEYSRLPWDPIHHVMVRQQFWEGD